MTESTADLTRPEESTPGDLMDSSLQRSRMTVFAASNMPRKLMFPTGSTLLVAGQPAISQTTGFPAAALVELA